MNDDLKRVNLRDIVDRISENTIVLPDFQRGFTWKENNRQKALLASVLTKLPIGTVLFLNVKTEDYGYKKIGKNERNIDNLEGKQEVKAVSYTHLTHIYSQTGKQVTQIPHCKNFKNCPEGNFRMEDDLKMIQKNDTLCIHENNRC